MRKVRLPQTVTIRLITITQVRGQVCYDGTMVGLMLKGERGFGRGREGKREGRKLKGKRGIKGDIYSNAV